jgi:hypothetical protein
MARMRWKFLINSRLLTTALHSEEQSTTAHLPEKSRRVREDLPMGYAKSYDRMSAHTGHSVNSSLIREDVYCTRLLR